MDYKLLFTACISLCCTQTDAAGFYAGNYYFSNPIQADWWDASRFCTFYGWYLIDIRDSIEHENIKNVIGSHDNGSEILKYNYWSSGVRFNDENRYYWETTGQPLIYTDWSPGDPNFGVQKCIFLEARLLQFADADCSSKLTFICRKTLFHPYRDCVKN